MKLLFFTNIKSNNIVQTQQTQQTQQFKLIGNITRKCASLKIQGNLRCSSCGGK
mgnify:CR=1 FL=1|tara:strand:+ start:192 stop:353 length:162 start_codon:yes stop_codon:yes gene_type:complete